MKLFYACMRNLCKGYFHLFYRHQIYGLEHYVPGRAIIAPNHVSFLDPPLVAASWPEEIAFLARKSLFDRFLFGTIISKLNAYPVSGTSQDLNSIKVICRLLKEDKKVVIFPEGFRSKDGQMLEIKSGIGMIAERCKCPIIPTFIEGSFDIWNRYRRFPKLWGKTACVFGKPIDMAQFSHLDKKAAQEACAFKVKASIMALKDWYEKGAEGSPP